MATIEIKHRRTGAVLYTFEASAEQQESGLAVRAALEDAAMKRAYLRGAYLSGAYLSGADLSGADLSGAYLRGADLIGADLSGADLIGADLSGAYLRGAYLRGKKITGPRPVVMLGPIGSRSDYVMAYMTDAGMMIRAGCFFGTRTQFELSLDEEHGNNDHGLEYRAALAYFDAHFAI